MKRTLALSLITTVALFTGCSERNAGKVPEEHTPTAAEIHEQIKKELFLDTLPTGEDGKPIYPDDYAGDFFIFDRWVFLLTDLDNASEYQYLKDGYSYVEFREEKYSYNYLQSLLDEYEASKEPDPDERLYIDPLWNRAVIEKTIYDPSKKCEEYFFENIPLYYQEIGVVDAL